MFRWQESAPGELNLLDHAWLAAVERVDLRDLVGEH